MLTLKFSTSGAAFDEDARREAASTLRRLALALERGTSAAPIYDTNGNKIGNFEFEDEREELL